MDISLDEANRLINLYFTAYPGIKQYIEASHSMAIANGYVIGPFGQRKMEFGAKEVFKGTAVYNGALRNAQNVRKFVAA